MKMNRLISVLLAIMLAISMAMPALALTTSEKEQQYETAISQLEIWLEGGHDVAELQGVYDAFKELGGYEQSKFFAYYVDVLIRIEDGQFDFQIDFDLKMLEQNAKFADYLSENMEDSIGGPAMLHAYADARRLEHDGNTAEAAQYYSTCLSFYDSSDRYERIALAEYSGHYEKGMELMASGDFVAAYSELSLAAGWEDSNDAMAFIVDTLGYNPMEHVHDWQPATCTTPKTCTGCGNTEGEALGHQWDDGIVTTPATCVSDGVMTYTCAVCGETKTISMSMDESNHSWLNATFDNPKACVWCGATEGEPLVRVKVGDYITYGTYPQTAAGNDNTPIEWQVLECDGNKALLISRYGLDCQKYNSSYTSVTWETCTLRPWLNDIFLNRAFSEAEQGAILTTYVDNSKGQCYSKWSTNGGNNTQDKIFLLSYAEANKYFNVESWEVSGAVNNTKSRVAPTAYAVKQSAYTDSSYMTADRSASGYWWLRSPGYNQSYAAGVFTDGSLSGDYVYNDILSVRPAFWLDLSGI